MDKDDAADRRGRRYISSVLREWEMDVIVHEPWEPMPRDDRFGELGRVVSVGLRTVLRDAPRGDVPSEFIRMALCHGRYRRLQGCPEEVLSYEIGALRRALRGALRSSSLRVDVVLLALDRAEELWPIAKRASALGFREPFLNDLSDGVRP